MRFYQLPIGAIFRTDKVDVPGGHVWNEYKKVNSTMAKIGNSFAVPFHALVPVWAIEDK